MASLFEPLQLGELQLANRIVMAPMTRNRAEPDGTPGALMVEHYAQRADAGLIVAEGTWPTAVGQAYCRQPGIATAAHSAGWRRLTAAVHARGGRIVDGRQHRVQRLVDAVHDLLDVAPSGRRRPAARCR